eukprot:6212518-Pleurochrysis_carterae.AAC.15
MLLQALAEHVLREERGRAPPSIRRGIAVSLLFSTALGAIACRNPTASACPRSAGMVLTKEDVASIEPVAHYTHDEDQAYLMLYGATRLSLGARGVQLKPQSAEVAPLEGRTVGSFDSVGCIPS